MATYIVNITGVSALLMHRFSENAEQEQTTRAIQIKRKVPREVAEQHAYRTKDGLLYLPGTAVARLLREAASSYKQRGSRKSLKYVIAGAILVLNDILILKDVEGKALKHFEVDSRPVVIPATKGRIMQHRPRLDVWNTEFSLQVDETIIDPETTQHLITDGGQRLGLGAFRPERGGPFGRFRLISWKELAQKATKLAAD